MYEDREPFVTEQSYAKRRVPKEQHKEIDEIAKKDVQIQVDRNPTDRFHEFIEELGER